MLYPFPKRKRWVTYEKSKKSETKVGYLSLFLHPFHRQPMLSLTIFFLEYLLGDPHIFFQILNQNINKTLSSTFGSFLDRKKIALYLALHRGPTSLIMECKCNGDLHCLSSPQIEPSLGEFFSKP